MLVPCPPHIQERDQVTLHNRKPRLGLLHCLPHAGRRRPGPMRCSCQEGSDGQHLLRAGHTPGKDMRCRGKHTGKLSDLAHSLSQQFQVSQSHLTCTESFREAKQTLSHFCIHLIIFWLALQRRPVQGRALTAGRTPAEPCPGVVLMRELPRACPRHASACSIGHAGKLLLSASWLS